MNFNTAKCERDALSKLKVMLAHVKSIVSAIELLITNCCYVLLIENDILEVT